MPIQLTLAFHELPINDAVRRCCEVELERLEHLFADVAHCHVTTSLVGGSRQREDDIEVRVRLAVAGGEIVAGHRAPVHRAGADFHLVIHEAFDAARRQLHDHAHRLRTAPAGADDGSLRGEACSGPVDGFLGPPHGDRLALHRPSSSQHGVVDEP